MNFTHFYFETTNIWPFQSKSICRRQSLVESTSVCACVCVGKIDATHSSVYCCHRYQRIRFFLIYNFFLRCRFRRISENVHTTKPPLFWGSDHQTLSPKEKRPTIFWLTRSTLTHAAKQTWSVRIRDLISGTTPTLSSSSTAMSLNIERAKRKQTHTSMKPDAVLPQGDIFAFNDFKIKIFFFLLTSGYIPFTAVLTVFPQNWTV